MNIKVRIPHDGSYVKQKYLHGALQEFFQINPLIISMTYKQQRVKIIVFLPITIKIVVNFYYLCEETLERRPVESSPGISLVVESLADPPASRTLCELLRKEWQASNRTSQEVRSVSVLLDCREQMAQWDVIPFTSPWPRAIPMLQEWSSMPPYSRGHRARPR